MSGQALGFVLAAAQIGYASLVTKPERNVGPIKGYITFEEHHTDELEITDHPIDQGAKVSDHAFKRPAELTIKLAWSASPGNSDILSALSGVISTPAILSSTLQGADVSQLKEIYQELLKLQEARDPFDVSTGKRLYDNMLIKSLAVVTDDQNENVLSVTISLKQVILVSTQLLTYIAAPEKDQAVPEDTNPPSNDGTKQLGDGSKIDQTSAEFAISQGA